MANSTTSTSLMLVGMGGTQKNKEPKTEPGQESVKAANPEEVHADFVKKSKPSKNSMPEPKLTPDAMMEFLMQETKGHTPMDKG